MIDKLVEQRVDDLGRRVGIVGQPGPPEPHTAIAPTKFTLIMIRSPFW